MRQDRLCSSYAEWDTNSSGRGWFGLDGGGVKRAADATFAKSHGRGGFPLVVRVGPLRGYSSLQRPRGAVGNLLLRGRGQEVKRGLFFL